MTKLAWTLFGALLAALLALGGFALDLMPVPAGAERPAKVIVTFDSEADDLRRQLSDLRLERDRLTADLSALEADQNTLLEDLSDIMAERDSLRARLADGATRTADAAPAPAGPANPLPTLGTPELLPVEGSDPVLVPEAAAPATGAPPSADMLGVGLRAYRDQDYERALESWLPLARAGNPRAQFFLGGLYSDGSGVPLDRVQAYVWLRRSDRGGHSRAETLLAEIIQLMTPVEIQLAESRLAEASF